MDFFGVGLLEEVDSDSLSDESEDSLLSDSELDESSEELELSSLELSASLDELSELLDTCLRFFFDVTFFFLLVRASSELLESRLLEILLEVFLTTFDFLLESLPRCFYKIRTN